MLNWRFFRLVQNRYRFLIEEHGFRVASKKSDYWYRRVLYKNATTAVEVTWETEYEYVSVILSRLIDGEVPDRFSCATAGNSFYLDDLVMLRCPDIGTHSRPFGEARDEDIVGWVDMQSRAVREYAKDILSGDFTVFFELAEITRRRAEEMTKANDQTIDDEQT